MQPADRRSLATAARLAAFYGAVFAVVGVQAPFWPVWLEARGLSAAEIGLVIAASFWPRVVTSLVIPHHADRLGERRRPMVFLAAITLIGRRAVRARRPVLDVHGPQPADRRDLRRHPAARRGAGPAGGARASAQLRPGAALGIDHLHRRRDRRGRRPAAVRAGDRAAGAPGRAGHDGGELPRIAGAAASAARRPAARLRSPAAAAGPGELRPGGRPDPGEPRRLLWLCDAALARGRPRRGA